MARFWLLVGIPVIAYGYTDPGTGAFAFQALFAVAMGAIWTARKAIRQALGGWKRQKPVND